jgi:hypothetical protein
MSTSPDNKPPTTPESESDSQENAPTPSEMLGGFVHWIRGYWNAPRQKSKWTEIVTVFLTLIIAAAAIWSAWIFQGQLIEARRATGFTQRQLEAAVRPWISAELAISGPITFDQQGARVDFTLWLKNVGHSPALNVDVNHKIINRQSGPPFSEIKQECRGIPWGDTIFPEDKPWPRRFALPADPSELDRSRTFTGIRQQELLLNIIGCIDYGMSSVGVESRPTDSRRLLWPAIPGLPVKSYYTLFWYKVFAIDNSGRSTTVIRNVPVPQNKIRIFRMTTIGGAGAE